MKRLKDLPARDRRALILGASIIAVAITVLRIAPALEARTEQASLEVQLARAELERASALLTNADRIRDTLEARASRLESIMRGAVGKGADGTMAATLGALVAAAARDAGLEVGALVVASDTARARRFGRPRVEGSARGDIAGLAQFLMRLEVDHALFAVRELTISQPDPSGASGQPEGLRIEFVIEALALREDDVPSV